MSEPKQIEQAILRLARDLAAAQGPTASLSPNDVARALSAPPPSEEWRGRLSAVRRAALRLAAAGAIDILRKGRPVAPEDARGVLRLRLRAPDAAAAAASAPSPAAAPTDPPAS